jgi:hypothetical protein
LRSIFHIKITADISLVADGHAIGVSSHVAILLQPLICFPYRAQLHKCAD